MKVTVLSGGVGGARFLRGLVDVVDPAELTVIGNVGDDLEILGLHVSPDLDSILYALAGLSDDERGWGRADESWRALESAVAFGGAGWFRLGDRDLGLHLVRTELLRSGHATLGRHCAARRARRARADAAPGDRRRAPDLARDAGGTASHSRSGSSHEGIATRSMPSATSARTRRRRRRAPAEALRDADLILIAPSNPYVSIGPILAVAELEAALRSRTAPVVAVSPLIGGPRGEGPGRPHARQARRRDEPGARRLLLRRA